MAESRCAIEAFNLTKEFNRTKGYRDLLFHPFRKQGLTALQDASFQVHQGEIVGLLGPNGAGKTTLLKLLSTLILPTKGTALINGYDLVTDAKRVKTEVGFVLSEERSFYWRLTGHQNLQFFAILYSLPKRQARERIEQVLELLDLKDAADMMFMKYSTGMKQRLSLARGLLADPGILLLDEPTKSLDPLTAGRLRQFIKEEIVRKQGRAVLLATHQLEEAEEICDRIAVMNKGRIVAFGAPEEIKAALKIGRGYVFVVDDIQNGVLEAISKLGEMRPSEDGQCTGLAFEMDTPRGQADVDDVIKMILNHGGKIRACYPKKLSLRQVLSGLIEGKEDRIGVSGVHSEVIDNG